MSWKVHLIVFLYKRMDWLQRAHVEREIFLAAAALRK